MKSKLLREHGLSSGEAARFELDHFIPLALGGHPRKLDNLWLQPWDGPHGAHAKDRLEVKLKNLVCAGTLSLQEALEAIGRDWEAALRRYVPSNDRALQTEPDD